MTYQFTAELVGSLGGRVREVRIDRLDDGLYAATVEVEGALGVRSVGTRASDALNLAAITGAPVLVSSQVADDSDRRQEGDLAEARLLRLAPTCRRRGSPERSPRSSRHVRPGPASYCPPAHC